MRSEFKVSGSRFKHWLISKLANEQMRSEFKVSTSLNQGGFPERSRRVSILKHLLISKLANEQMRSEFKVSTPLNQGGFPERSRRVIGVSSFEHSLISRLANLPMRREFKVSGSMFKYLLIISLANLLITSSFAQNATVKAVLDSTQILIGDQVNLDISVEFNELIPVAWPAFKDSITGQLEIVQASIPDTIKKETGETIIHQRLVLTSFDTGFIVLPPITFIFNGDSTQSLSTEPLLLFVSDIPVEMEADIKDIKEPYDVPFNWKSLIKWGVLALIIIALLIGGFLLWKKYRKVPEAPIARPKPKRPAHEIALEKLEELRLKKLWQNNQTKQFHIELSDIVREYIEFRYDVLALEMTTQETISALKLKGLEDTKTQTLKQMLQMADLAKFAKYTPISNENEQCFDIARQFVNATLVMPLDEPKIEEQKG